MLRVFSHKSKKIQILLCLFILSFAILQVSPVEVNAAVTASTDTISEDFTNTTFMDSLQTNASWSGDGSVRIPPQTIRFIDSCEISGSGFGVVDSYIDGTMMFIANMYTGIDIVDISDPAHPAFVTHVPVSDARAVAVSGSWMYVADNGPGFQVYNITDYQNIQLVSTFGPSEASDVYVEGSYAYLSTYDQGIKIFDVTNPQSLVSVANYTTIDNNKYLTITKAGDYLFTSAGTTGINFGIHILNVTDPTDPTFVSRGETDRITHNVFVVNDYVFAARSNYTFIAMSISNISNPHIINSIEGMRGYSRGCLTYDNEYAYSCDFYSGGLRVVDFSNPYSLQVDIINQSIASQHVVANDGFIYTAGYIDETWRFEANSLDWAYNAVVSSLSVYEPPLDTFYVTQATLTATDTIPTSTSIDYYMSVDDGIWWEPVESGILHSFSRTGSNLKWKAILDTSIPSYTPEISSISISLKIQLKPPVMHDHSVVPDYNKPSFSWDELDGADGYRFQLDEVSTFDSPNLIDEFFDYSTSITYAIETPLENGTYYYRIAAIDEDGDIGVFSYPRVLSIGTLTTNTTTTTIDETGIPLDPMILAIGAIAIIGLVAVVVIIQKRKSG